jgi:hypothetical protein
MRRPLADVRAAVDGAARRELGGPGPRRYGFAPTRKWHCAVRGVARVTDYETLWPGGDLLFDHVVIEARDATVGFDLDGRMHDRADAVVAALGGMGPR